jgi:sirohydrochlorin cobaltochelatase
MTASTTPTTQETMTATMTAPQAPGRTGLLLFAHGARDPAWARPFAAVADRCRARQPGTAVALAFLEFMAPDLVAAGSALVAQGCRRVDVVPLFLGAGGHVRKDIPVLLARLQADHPDVSWILHHAVGEHEWVIAAMADAALAAPGSAAVAVR